VAGLEFAAGVDPKAKASCGTLRATIEAHRAAYAHLRPRSQRNYNSSIVRYLDGWLDLPLSQISRDMVEKRHKEIAAEVEARHTKAAAENKYSAAQEPRQYITAL